MLGQHRDKLLGQGISLVEIVVSETDLFYQLVLLLVELGLLAHIQPGGSCWRQTRFDAGFGSGIDRPTYLGAVAIQAQGRRGSSCLMVLTHTGNEEAKQSS